MEPEANGIKLLSEDCTYGIIEDNEAGKGQVEFLNNNAGYKDCKWEDLDMLGNEEEKVILLSIKDSDVCYNKEYFDAIVEIEGKKPDLIKFPSEVWPMLVYFGDNIYTIAPMVEK